LLAYLDRGGRLHPGGLASLGEREIGAALDYAIAAAALTCTRRGADLPTRAEVDAFIERSL
jgi:fructokinase